MAFTRTLLPKAIVRILVLVGAWAALGVAALYRARSVRIEAGKFMGDLVELEVGKSELQEVASLVDKYHGKWRKGPRSDAGSSCGPGASVVDFTFENRWLHWFLLSPQTSLGATVYVKDNHLCFRALQLFSTVEGSTVFYVEEFRKSPFQRPFMVHLNLVKTIVTMEAAATAAQRSAAYSINLGCLTKVRGCRDAREMAPALWQNSREVAPTYWKSQWDE